MASPEILPPLWGDKLRAEADRIRSLADDAVDDLMERLGDDEKPVDIGDVPRLLRDAAHRIETLLSMIGNNVKK